MMKKAKKIMLFLLSCVAVSFMMQSFMVKAEEQSGADIDRSGILQINVYHYDSNTDTKYFIQSGSGFLITDSQEGTQYVITCDHVAEVSKDDQKTIKKSLDVKKLNIKIEIVVTRDITETATLVKASEVDDFAILKLDAPIHQKKAMTIRPEGAELTEDVYAMGYPAAISALTDFSYYSEDEVTVSKGSVSLCEMSNNGVPYVQHSASMTNGCSGGPLVDSNGYVVGLNTFTFSLGDATYYYSLKISEVTNALDMLGISYQTPDGNKNEESSEEVTDTVTENSEASSDDVTGEATEEATPSTEALPTVDTSALDAALTEATGYLESDYTEDSFSSLQTAITDAKAVKNNVEATQADIDKAAGNLQNAIDGLEKASNSTLIIIIIIAAVVVIAIIIIIIVMMKSNKKKSEPVRTNGTNVYPVTPTGIPAPSGASQSAAAVPPVPPMQPPVMPQAPVAPPVQPVMPNSMPSGGYVGEGAGETSVLGYGTGETTVLGGTNQMKATLTRVKTNEKVDIVKQLFRIGKERNKVDYCITNNNSVSRIHADIVYKNGQYYIIDNNSTNYTFLNGQMIPAKQEIALSDGDRVKLSEEEFVFKLG